MSRRAQRSWGRGDTGHPSAGRARASDVSCKLGASSRTGSARKEGSRQWGMGFRREVCHR